MKGIMCFTADTFEQNSQNIIELKEKNKKKTFSIHFEILFYIVLNT